MKKLMNLLLITVSSVIFINVIGCSHKSEVSSTIYSFTPEEENQLLTLAYDFLENSLQDNIVDWGKGKITGFKSGSKFEILTNENNETKDIKDIQIILVTFEPKKESKLKSIQVYLDENGENVLGFIAKK
ncbi:hypothetical protein ABET41_09700 [Metabacillus fastidiosus]|uniref:DUF3887 domain-containing protein n=1 Tax=Metabacillus fastidiosus TaxID=1458 RepID=A0ABU6P0S1_9BACI|nr:hypothetical protein [Metabacillus fastidiosus]MED4402583.1 hypothetical protein [Metabacillus fastidiosus]MED4461943.1 hypothetical protein [Metabacillus fastidiosus]